MSMYFCDGTLGTMTVEEILSRLQTDGWCTVEG